MHTADRTLAQIWTFAKYSCFLSVYFLVLCTVAFSVQGALSTVFDVDCVDYNYSLRAILKEFFEAIIFVQNAEFGF